MAKEKQSKKREAAPAKGDMFTVYSAGVLALTDPGPAAAGVVVVAPDGRTISQRAYYLGNAGQSEAGARALLAALRLAQSLDVAPLRLAVESQALLDLVAERRPADGEGQPIDSTIIDLLKQLPIVDLTLVQPGRNPARAVALAPLMQWLPERTRRAHALEVRTVRPGIYDVASESQPGRFYRVHLPEPAAMAAGEAISCECADFQYRGVPCKHILVAARAAGAGRERLFYPEAAGGPSIPSGPVEANPGGDGEQREAGGTQ